MCCSWRLLFTLPSSAHVYEFQRAVWTVQHPRKCCTKLLVKWALNEKKTSSTTTTQRTASPPPLGVRTRTKALGPPREQAHRAPATNMTSRAAGIQTVNKCVRHHVGISVGADVRGGDLASTHVHDSRMFLLIASTGHADLPCVVCAQRLEMCHKLFLETRTG